MLVAFGAIEIGIRVYYGNPPIFYFPQVRHIPTAYGYKPEPNQRDTFTTDQPIVTNSAGFRDTEEWAIPKPAGQYRVMLLGDSLTFGNAVATDAVYAQRVEQQLKTQLGDVEVLNASAGGWGLRLEIQFFEDEGLSYAPDVLVLGFFPNDWESPPRPGTVERPLQPARLTADARVEGRPSWLQWLPYQSIFALKRSATVMFVRDRLDVLRSSGPDFVTDLLLNRVDLDRNPIVQHTYAHLARLHSICEAHGVKLVIAFIPPVNYFWVPRDSVSFPAHMGAFAASKHITFVDLSQGMKDAPPRPALYMYPWDNHLSPAGHQRVADQLAPLLSRILQERRTASNVAH